MVIVVIISKQAIYII